MVEKLWQELKLMFIDAPTRMELWFKEEWENNCFSHVILLCKTKQFCGVNAATMLAFTVNKKNVHLSKKTKNFSLLPHL